MGEKSAFIAMPTAPGLWRMAQTYADAAEVLITAGEPGLHQFDEPALHLAEQAIELALKGFLRTAGRTPEDLKAYGHRLADLMAACRSSGLDATILDASDTIRVVDTLVAVGKMGHGYRYPCNATNLWIEPNVALAFARRLLGAIKERCTMDSHSGAGGLSKNDAVTQVVT